MGKRDGEYVLAGRIELDEGYFTTEIYDNERDMLLKRGCGSQKKSKVLVMAESEFDFDLKDFVPRHEAQVIPKEKVGEIFPWGHIAISNYKRQIFNTFHNVKPEFLQKYLDEFCCKFNRRYFGEAFFNRLLVAYVNYKNEFRYVYG